MPVRTWSTFIPRSKRPEQMRTKARRSLCALSMFAWILKTKPLKGASVGTTPWSLVRGAGPGIISQKPSRNASRPKLFIALPKNIGERSPARKRLGSNASPAASSSSDSSRRRR